MGLITDLYGSDWREIDSEVNQGFITAVRAALGGAEFSAELGINFPPNIGGCVDIDFGGVLEAGASTDAVDAFDYAQSLDDPDFEKTWVLGLFDMTLEILDVIPMGPYAPPILDPSFTIDLSYFDFSCFELPEFMACFIKALAAPFDDCVCDWITGEPSAEIQAWMDEEGYDNFCDFFIEIVLPSFFPWELEIPWPPSLPFDFPPDWCALFFPPDIDCDWDWDLMWDISFMFTFEWAITWVWDFCLKLPQLFIDLSGCIIDSGFDPCEIVACVVDTLVEMMQIDALIEAMVPSISITFVAALAAYVQIICIFLIQIVLGFIFGVGVVVDCIGEFLGLPSSA